MLKRREILAIDLSGDAIKAVAVKRRGKEAIILAAAEVKNSPFAINGPQIDKVLGKLGRYPKRAVLVSPEVKFLTSELPLSPDAKISSDKLQEAVRWEAQAYLDFSASEGLFGYQLQRGAYPLGKGVSNGAGKRTKTTPVFITAMSREDYGRLADTCKSYHLILGGVYAKESAFLFSINRFSKDSANRIVLDLKRGSDAAFINSGNPTAFQNGPLAQYAACTGAALQELGIIGQGRLGINDRVNLVRRLKKKIHTLPLIVVGITALAFLAHFSYMKASFWQYSSRIKGLEIEKKELENNISKFKGLTTQIRDSYKKMRYIQEVLPAQHKRLIDLFDGITREIPNDIILDRITQDKGSQFLLEGAGLSAGSITTFVGRLERLGVTREAKLETINEKKAGAENTGLFVYQFKIKAVLE